MKFVLDHYRGTCLAIFLMICALASITTPAQAAQGPVPPAQRIKACVYEDGATQRTCFWDADSAGNGKGSCFLSRDYGKTTVYMTCSALRKYVRTHTR